MAHLPDEVLLNEHPLHLVQVTAMPVTGEILAHGQALHGRLQRQREGDFCPWVGHQLVETARHLEAETMFVNLSITHRSSARHVPEYLG